MVLTSHPTRSTAENIAIFLCFAFFMTIIVGFTPFTSREVSTIDLEGEGSSLRQITLLILAALSLPLMVSRRKEFASIAAATPFFLLLMGWCWLSSTWAISPDISTRRIFGTTLVTLMGMFAATLPAAAQMRLLLFMLVAILGLDYFGIIALHSGSVHAEGGYWKGFHNHKNVAGYFCATASLIFIHMAWFRRNKGYYLLALAAFIFLVCSFSKTSMGLFAAVFVLSFLYRRALFRGVPVQLILLMGAIGLVALVPIVYAVLAMVSSGEIDITLTGRTEIWDFVIMKAAEAPFGGWGYGSFWGIGDLSPSQTEAPLTLAGFSHGHNGYLDMLVSTGAVGLILSLGTLFTPIVQFFRAPVQEFTLAQKESCLCGLILLSFGILHNLTESSIFQGVVPIWPFTMLGLYMVASACKFAAGKGEETHA